MARSSFFPDSATESKALHAAADAIKTLLLDPLRGAAVAEDAFDINRPKRGEGPEILGGGRGREHFALACAEWGMQYGYLKALAERADEDDSS
jgi:hypothetical protein